MDPIYHLTEASTWEAAKGAGEYRQSTRGATLERVGFIHTSLKHQVRKVGEFVYADADNLVLLVIDPAKVESEIRYEPGEPGATEEFPHIYGPLPVDAVVNVFPVTRDHAGRMVLPG